MPGQIFHDLHQLRLDRNKQDEYFGTLVNAYIAQGGTAYGVGAGQSHVDVGTLHGYRSAMQLLSDLARSVRLTPLCTEHFQFTESLKTAKRFAKTFRMQWILPLASVVLMCGCASTPKGVPMKLAVDGERGMMFTATYTVDGVRQEETATIPATISFAGQEAEWEVRRPSGDRAFSVEFWVNNLVRQVTHSSGQAAIRGKAKITGATQSTWSHPVD